MKLLGAYIPATAAIGFTTESAVYCGAPGSAPPASKGVSTSTAREPAENIVLISAGAARFSHSGFFI